MSSVSTYCSRHGGFGDCCGAPEIRGRIRTVVGPGARIDARSHALAQPLASASADGAVLLALLELPRLATPSVWTQRSALILALSMRVCHQEVDLPIEFTRGFIKELRSHIPYALFHRPKPLQRIRESSRHTAGTAQHPNDAPSIVQRDACAMQLAAQHSLRQRKPGGGPRCACMRLPDRRSGALAASTHPRLRRLPSQCSNARSCIAAISSIGIGLSVVRIE